MGKNKGKNKVSGSSAFDAYYNGEFAERWQSIKSALFTEPQYITLHYSNYSNPNNDLAADEYYIGRASALVGLLTPVKCATLDMCAAPGGKSLILSNALSHVLNSEGVIKIPLAENDGTGQQKFLLWTNDVSFERVFRLRETIKKCVPADILQFIKVTCQKGEYICLKNPATFDTILLDAPCSSERHVLNNSKYLKEWTPSRVKSLALQQYALLSAAYIALKPGGYIMYSTCALAQKENDGVVERLLQKHKAIKIVYNNDSLKNSDCGGVCGDLYKAIQMALTNCSIISIDDKDAINSLVIEPTKYGYAIMPDENSGSGPMYFSLLQKMEPDS